jgi:branched-chain amino acid transport system substrate-binding protein
VKASGGALLAATVLLAAAPAARAAEPIAIGFGMALTGGLALNGKSALLAMQMWQCDINAKGGLLGRPRMACRPERNGSAMPCSL